MKINSKLMLITATLGLMAAASATAFASNETYIHFTNNSPKQVTITSNWKDTPSEMGRHVSRLTLGQGQAGSFVIYATPSVTNANTTGEYGKLHVKFNGNSADMVVVNFKAEYSNFSLLYFHEENAYIGNSAQSALQKMGLTEYITGANQSSGNTYNAFRYPNQPDSSIYAVGFNQINVVISGATSSTSSPMGKISSLFNSIKL